MANPAYVLSDQLLTPEAYLLQENDNLTEMRQEYVNGLIYAMAGASRDHNRVVRRLMRLLNDHLEGTPCEPFQSDMKVKVQRANDVRFYYPDIHVTCEPETDCYYNEQPCLIVEMLPDFTQRIDRIEKRLAYQMLESLQEYVLLAQNLPYMEIYQRECDFGISGFKVCCGSALWLTMTC